MAHQRILSANGNAVVLWNDTATNSTFAVTSIGLTWQTPTLLDTLITLRTSVGMDANGNAIALWEALNPTVPDLKRSQFDNAHRHSLSPKLLTHPSIDLLVL